jgi:hypothetical protein
VRIVLIVVFMRAQAPVDIIAGQINVNAPKLVNGQR